MKFLQEMIAKKKATADLPPGAAPMEDNERLEPFQDILKRDNLDAIHADEDENPVAAAHSLSGSNGATMSELEEKFEAKSNAEPETVNGFEDASASYDPDPVPQPVEVEPALGETNGIHTNGASEIEAQDLRAEMAPPPPAMDPTDPYLEDEEGFEELEELAAVVEDEPVAETPAPVANGSGLRIARAEEPLEAVVEADIDDLDAHDAEEDLREAFSGEGAVQRFEPPAEEQIAAKIDERMADAAGKDQPAAAAAAPKKIWDLAKNEGGASAPAATEAKPARRAGRVKTRLLGFQSAEDPTNKVFEEKKNGEANAAAMFPVGWIVVIDGPGRGASFALQAGASQIGRGDDQAVKLDFGDTSISRENHAAIAYDDEQNKFFIGHGGKSNLVRLNDMPVLSTEPLSNDDTIRIGETTLKFVAFCGEKFVWENAGSDAPVGHAANQ